MCCCGKPVINGEFGYKWQPADAPSIRPVDPPDVGEHELLVFDEPGRCGGIDSHCHHYRVIRLSGSYDLLVRHGAGQERVRLSNSRAVVTTLETLDTNARYWILNALYHASADGKRTGSAKQDGYWHKAAAQKRIKTRQLPKGRGVRVWIEPENITSTVAVAL